MHVAIDHARKYQSAAEVDPLFAAGGGLGPCRDDLFESTVGNHDLCLLDFVSTRRDPQIYETCTHSSSMGIIVMGAEVVGETAFGIAADFNAEAQRRRDIA